MYMDGVGAVGSNALQALSTFVSSAVDGYNENDSVNSDFSQDLLAARASSGPGSRPTNRGRVQSTYESITLSTQLVSTFFSHDALLNTLLGWGHWRHLQSQSQSQSQSGRSQRLAASPTSLPRSALPFLLILVYAYAITALYIKCNAFHYSLSISALFAPGHGPTPFVSNRSWKPAAAVEVA